MKAAPDNATTIIDYTLAEMVQYNIKPATCENRIKVLIWLSEHHNHKNYAEMTAEDIQLFLGRVRKSPSEDPPQRWIGSWNGRYNRADTSGGRAAGSQNLYLFHHRW